jgi:hypothetical protein
MCVQASVHVFVHMQCYIACCIYSEPMCACVHTAHPTHVQMCLCMSMQVQSYSTNDICT